VLNNLHIKSTATTPEIMFNCESGELKISGRVIPDETEMFWSIPLNWISSFLDLKNHKYIELNFNIEYFNISSSKIILSILYKFNEVYNSGSNIKVVWNYRSEDEDMYEVGRDYEHMVSIPFEFIEINEKLLF
jgi:hypothetical protein